MSPRLQVAVSTESTNADVVRHVTAQPEAWPHLSVLLTTDQRAGRGRLGRDWISPPDAALAVSTLVRVRTVPVAARGWIPLAAGVALAHAIENQLEDTTHRTSLKWPNDILVDGDKIAGILAEVVPGEFDAVVIGTGINTRMSAAPVPSATSFLLLGRDQDDDWLLADYLSGLEAALAALQEASGDAEKSGLHASVTSYCLTLGREVRVSLPTGAVLIGRASHLDVGGRLVVETDDGEVAVSAGDVVHVR